MLVLGIETSGDPGSVALCRDGAVLVERELASSGGRRRRAQTLVAEIDRLFRENSLRPADCNVVAVSMGPGSFTGLRVGVVCAKTFAYATGCAPAGVDTFLSIAENSPADVDDVFVVGDAQRGDLYVGRYRRASEMTWRVAELRERRPAEPLSRQPPEHRADNRPPSRPIDIVAAAEWFASRSANDVVTGPGIDRINLDPPPACRLLGPDCRQPRAAVVALVGRRQVEAGQVHDFWSLEPRYVRRSAAEEKYEKTDSKSAEQSADPDSPA